MNCEKFISTLAKLILGAVAIGGMLALGAQTATAQAITVATPFAFSAGSQSYPAGTYQFTRLSEWSLSIRNLSGGGVKFLTVYPEESGPLGSYGSVIFRNSEGHRSLEAVYIPGTDRVAELLQQDTQSKRAKSDISLTSAAPSEKVTVVKQNAMGR